MPEGMKDLESALRQLRPAPVTQGPMLIEMGRGAAMRSARTWRWVSAMSTTTAVMLAGFLLMRPEPPTRVQFVQIPAIVPIVTIPNEPNDSIEPTQAPMSDWRFLEHQIRTNLEPISEDDGDDYSPLTHRPLRAGDAVQKHAVWQTITTRGVR